MVDSSKHLESFFYYILSKWPTCQPLWRGQNDVMSAVYTIMIMETFLILSEFYLTAYYVFLLKEQHSMQQPKGK